MIIRNDKKISSLIAQALAAHRRHIIYITDNYILQKICKLCQLQA